MTIYSDNYDRQLLAEVYDQVVTDTADVDLLRNLLAGQESLSILESFCGTGRILVPLLKDGHFLTGIELAPAMVERARRKAEDSSVSARLTLKTQDAMAEPWGAEEYDVCIIGCNALFELSTSEMQESCIRQAFNSLRPGGKLFIDNDNWTRPLDDTVGQRWVSLEGMGRCGTYARQSAETVSVEPEKGIMNIKRTWFTRSSSGAGACETYMTTKRPLSGKEVEAWLVTQGFNILKAYGDYHCSPFLTTSPRAIFWAQR